MDHSADFCRAQAAMHEAKAAESSLPNVVTIAKAAAASWLREAQLCELRERRRARFDSAG